MDASCRINLRIASGSCSPAAAVKVYDLSNPLGPSIFISHASLPREPAIDTRQSPGLSLRACSTRTLISFDSCVSPRFCNSMVTAMPEQFYRTRAAHSWCKPVKSAYQADCKSAMNRLSTIHVENRRQARTKDCPSSGDCRGTLAGSSVARTNRKGCDIGYAPAACSCERAYRWIHVPSQPLM